MLPLFLLFPLLLELFPQLLLFLPLLLPRHRSGWGGVYKDALY
ncbi:hypothetical protein TUZN_0059 [Thermoproteus uzoniensis 768-20]|uniref:Uncharacterized protein n=1 Tax=Thermoproteus uzoniensis (strain 768-20) TaxID=999630 RepID=F2L115_THEU7|nr:hypothetical protein TUZN_0059 [Thermoproteus uzoniensis 768-20]